MGTYTAFTVRGISIVTGTIEMVAAMCVHKNIYDFLIE